ncbi:MAG TPA: hypothetical protein VF786_02970 [Terriglobales bacterium]
MKKLYTVVAAFVLTAGASAALFTVQAPVQSQANAINVANDAAYRDGLFVGERAATKGEASHVAVGRWATPHDRDAFLAGYSQAFAEHANVR